MAVNETPLIKMLPINGVNIAVREQGQDNASGIPVLLVHGFPFDHSMWNRVFDEVGFEHHLRLIAPDLRGLGASSLPDGAGPTSMEQFADDLFAVLEVMNIRQKIVLCGLSMGGYVAMQYMQKYGDTVAKLVLCDTKTTADSPQVAENRRLQAQNLIDKPGFLSTVADTMLPNLFAAKTLTEKPDVVQEMRTLIESNNPRGAAAATLGMANRLDSTEYLKKLDIPVLVLCGSEDKLSPPAEMKKMANQAKKGEYIEIAESGHLPPVEQPTHFVHALRDLCFSCPRP